MRRLASACSEPGCPNVALPGGRCDVHQRRDMRPNIYRRYGPAWASIRWQVLAEEPFCRNCGRPSRQVDHIDANAMNMARGNLQALCASCHSSKTSREGGRWG